MNIHPLFAGFKAQDPAAVGAALGFDVRIVTTRDSLLPFSVESMALIESRFVDAGGVVDYNLAGRWEAPGVHCLMFAKPLTSMAAACWLIGLGESAQEKMGGIRASDFYSGASVLQDLETGAYIASGDRLVGWPRVTPDQSALFVEAFALLVDGFALHTDNEPGRPRLECGA